MNTQSNDLIDTNDDAAALAAESLLNEIEQGTTLAADDDLTALAEVEVITEGDKDEPVTGGVTATNDDDADLGIDRSGLYEEQGAGALSVGTEEEQAAVEHDGTPVVAEKTKKGGRKSAATPGADANPTTRSGALKKKADVTGLLSLGYDEEAVDQMMTTIDAAPKKVGEKASNLIRYALGREHVSNFTRFTLSKLRDTPEGFTIPELVAMLQAERSYTVGTARSQAQQQSRLFGLFDMVSKDGKKIVLVGDNPLAKAVLGRLAGDKFVGAPAPEAEEDAETSVAADVNDALTEDEAPTVEAEAEAPSPAPATIAQTRKNRNKGRNKSKQGGDLALAA